jgi:hypothetical protein
MLHPFPKMSHIITKSCQREGTGDQNASQKLTLGSSGSHFSSKFAKVVPSKMHGMHSVSETFSLFFLPFADCMRKKTILTSWSELFSAWVVPSRGKFVHWGTQGSPKTPKAAQSDAPGLPKCIKKTTLGLCGEPRDPVRSQEHPQSIKKHENDPKIEI